MSELFQSALLLVAVAVFLASAAALIRPFRPFPGRGAALGGVLAALGAAAALSTLTASRPSSIPIEEWNRRVAICRKGGGLMDCPLSLVRVAEAEKNGSSPKPVDVAAQTAAVAPVAQVLDRKVVFKGHLSELTAAGRPCDSALKAASRIKGRYAGYKAARQAEQACRQAMVDIGNIKFEEPFSLAERADFNAAIYCFSLAYAGRLNAMADAAKVLDGDLRPSSVANFQSELKDALERSDECGLKLAVAAAKAHVD